MPPPRAIRENCRRLLTFRHIEPSGHIFLAFSRMLFLQYVSSDLTVYYTVTLYGCKVCVTFDGVSNQSLYTYRTVTQYCRVLRAFDATELSSLTSPPLSSPLLSHLILVSCNAQSRPSALSSAVSRAYLSCPEAGLFSNCTLSPAD